MSADHQLSQANLDNPVEITICRTFAAPRELVWLAWTDPSHVGRWWGPAGFNGTQAQRNFFTAFHGSMHQGWTGTMQQLAEFLEA